MNKMATAQEHADISDILQEYHALMKNGWLYGTLYEEIQNHKEWMQKNIRWLENARQWDNPALKNERQQQNVSEQKKVIENEVREREAALLGALSDARRYLRSDPDKRLTDDLTTCRRLWTTLTTLTTSTDRPRHDTGHHDRKLIDGNNTNDIPEERIDGEKLRRAFDNFEEEDGNSGLQTTRRKEKKFIGNKTSPGSIRPNVKSYHTTDKTTDVRRSDKSRLISNASTSNETRKLTTATHKSRRTPDRRTFREVAHQLPSSCPIREAKKGHNLVTKWSLPYQVFIERKAKTRSRLDSVSEGSESDSSLTISYASWSTDTWSIDTLPHSTTVHDVRSCFTSILVSDTDPTVSSLTYEDACDDRQNPASHRRPTANPRRGISVEDHQTTPRLSAKTMDHCVPDITDSLQSPRCSPLGARKYRPLPLKLAERKLILLENGGSRSSMTPSPTSSPTPPRVRLGTRASPSGSEAEDDENVSQFSKRRRMNCDTPSPCVTPNDLTLDDSTLDLTSESDLLTSSMLLRPDFGDSFNDSQASSPTMSPSTSIIFQNAAADPKKGGGNFRGRYKKDELWPAIQGNYQFLMGGEIIETCKSTESDLSWESDDVASNITTVSFIEFFQQYKELTDWLNHIQIVTQRQSSSLSERYLNQTYHEEMLQSSPRRKLFNDYAKQLMRRYPSRKDEVLLRLQHLNKLWAELEAAISPLNGHQDQETMLNDLEQDLIGLRQWLHEVEARLLPLCIHPDWTAGKLREKLEEHQVLQRDIQAHSKIVSAVLKLCERLHTAGVGTDKKLLAESLERQWHAILLQSLEWQCRLEEAICNGIKQRPSLVDCTTPDSDDSFTGYASNTSENSFIPNGNHGNSTYNAHDDDGLESDTSNFDVIPFSESEYEKITGDTDCQTDDNLEPAKSASVAIPSRKRRSPERCEGMEHCGTDSALGRSVSDPSLSAEQQAAIYHSSIKLTHDRINQAVNEAVATRNGVTMRSAQEPMVVMSDAPRERATRPVSLKVESHDVGYSSESHSNEEQEYNRFKEINGNIHQNGARIPPERIGAENPTRNAVDQEGNQAQIANLRTNVKKLVDNAWRYSMTSAYDTSSNCSDHNCSPDDLEANSPPNSSSYSGHSESNRISGPHGLPRQNMSSLLSTPNQNFYQMTTIDTDSEATSTADHHVPIDDPRSGAATDAESELSKSLELPYDDTPIRFEGGTQMSSIKGHESSAKARLDAVFENVESLDTPMGSLDSPAQVVPSCPRDRQMFFDEDQLMDEAGGCEEMCESNALFEMEDYVDSKHEAPSQPQDCNGLGSPEMGSTPVKSTTRRPENPLARKQDSVSKLLHQANLLALDEDMWPLKNTPWFDTPVRCTSNKFARTPGKMEVLSQSFNSTDGSMLATDASVPSGPSACEASCEGTSSESEGEYSSMTSGSDVEGSGYMNSTFVNSKSADTTLCGSPAHSRSYLRGGSSASVGQGLFRCRTRRLKNLSPSSDDLESAQYSVSESAINELRSTMSTNKQMLHRLRRATSDLPSLASAQRQTTPRKIRRRRVRRAGSEESANGKISLSPIKLLQSQSLPSSRRHSSRSHSRSLSPASLQKAFSHGSDADGLAPIQQEEPAQLQDMATAEAATPAVPVPVQADALLSRLGCVAATADTDTESVPRHDQSLTSAAEFSENAWDNLHHIYPSISSDPGEEKLDASDLQKDWDFPPPPVVIDGPLAAPPVARDATNRTPPPPEKTKTRNKEKRISNSKMAASAEDSDSDWDEIHSVIDDARKAFNFTENTLKKFRKDNMETGIFIDPSEYDGPLETCEEHIVCLEELRSVLEAKTNPDADAVEIHEITDLIDQWRELAALAVERQTQSASLCAIYRDLVTLQKSLPEACGALEEEDFDSVRDLEHNIKVLQENKMLLRQEYRDKVAALVSDLADFEQRYPGLKMGRFDEEVTLLQNRLELAMERSVSRASDLQAILTSWYDFSETRRELEYLLGQEKRHLRCLDGTEDVVLQMFSPQDLQDTLRDLKALDRELECYERKLQSMKRAQSEVARVHSQTAHRDMSATLDDIEVTFSTLRSNCQTMTAKIQLKLNTVDKETQVSIGVDARLSTVAQNDKLSMSAGRNSLCWRLLKVALPIQLALVFGFSLLCLYDPEYCEPLSRIGLVFSPHLHYVNGPPPT